MVQAADFIAFDTETATDSAIACLKLQQGGSVFWDENFPFLRQLAEKGWGWGLEPGCRDKDYRGEGVFGDDKIYKMNFKQLSEVLMRTSEELVQRSVKAVNVNMTNCLLYTGIPGTLS
ncbi:MAG: hypothetical protein RBS55_10025 [Bacteroidales bacterium]|jgi:hypothetical protein|nr:hypothetical protein [Bacteroidales bacterium]